MIGMLQIITYLLCIYLVYKGVEILQIALMSNREDGRKIGLTTGILAVVASVIIAIGIAYLQDLQAQSVGNSLPDLRR